MIRILLLLMLLLPATAWCEPIIVFLAEKHDFGAARPGDKLEFTFEFTNEGSDELVISRVSPFS
jgi:hypothetical protein